ncbi:MAG: hypothetical protein RBR82_12385 [Pseudomonas sp.]|nr:hypothetical protein [Pseudomonas sp.]
MELVANIWPIVDQDSGVVQRYLIKAYALGATDDEISTVLTTLARYDYRTAHPVVIPEKHKLVFGGGTISGALSIGAFQQNLSTIIEPELRKLEKSLTEIHNYGVDMQGNPRVPQPLRFPETPYFVTTVLLESSKGELLLQL